MKTIEVKIKDVDYVIGRLNAADSAFISMTMFAPLILSMQTASSDGDADGICKILQGLKKDEYSSVTNSLFELIKVREKNSLCSIFNNGEFLYENILDDAEIYLSLLKSSFILSFGDFLASAGRVFPAIAAAQTGISEMLKRQD